MEYDEHEAELREAIETGRRYKIAGEVLKKFLDERREEIILNFEENMFISNNDICDMLSELRVMKKFRNLCNTQIDIGELAEKELSENGND